MLHSEQPLQSGHLHLVDQENFRAIMHVCLQTGEDEGGKSSGGIGDGRVVLHSEQPLQPTHSHFVDQGSCSQGQCLPHGLDCSERTWLPPSSRVGSAAGTTPAVEYTGMVMSRLRTARAGARNRIGHRRRAPPQRG